MLTENEMKSKTVSSKAKARILLLEDDADLQALLTSYYTPRGYEISCFEDPTTPLRDIQGAADPNTVYDLVLTDLRMPRVDGMEFIQRMKKIAPKVPIILMTAHSSVEIALKAVEEGAYDFVVKPLHFPQLNVSIERALRLRQVEIENQALRTAVKSANSFEGYIGKSDEMKTVFDLARRVSSSTATVLITGESGSGKEVVARSIHLHGTRKDGPFVAINCSAIPEHLLEAELFGHSKGAFTGAVDKKIGLFEEANGGILFLDEIGDLSASLQAKLLRVLQERKIKRVGENVFRPIDVRILAATHKNLAQEVKAGRFREDLFFRLNVIPIKVPALRERPKDIVPLAEHFLARFSVENNSVARSFSKASLDHLLRLPWRGNVRELENAVERACVLCEDAEVGIKDLPSFDTQPLGPIASAEAPAAPVVERAAAASIQPPRESSAHLFSQVESRDDLVTLDAFILQYVELVLRRVGGVKEQAARVLGIDRKTLYRRIEELRKLRAPEESARGLKVRFEEPAEAVSGDIAEDVH
jgi:DNA-binding NtrC family response regulator